LDIQILPRHFHAQLPELLAKSLSCSRVGDKTPDADDD